MSRSLLIVLLGLGASVMDDGSNALLAQDAYPRVYGPTGRPYGPTQAHYQYERQYGRPWHGGPAPFDPNTGANFQINTGFPGFGGVYFGNAPAFGYGYQPPFLPGYGLPGYAPYPVPQYQLAPRPLLPQFGNAPAFSWQQPDQLQQQFPQQNPRMQPPPAPVPGPAAGNIAAARPVGPPEPVMGRPHGFMPAEPSTVAQRQKSMHLQGQGDLWFRQQNYLQAYSRYKQAAGAAPDLAAPRFRMAYALMAMQRYELAVPEVQRGIQLDPQYPIRGESPQVVYGEENRLAAAALPQAVAAWVRQDIRSPDRLFLLGTLLMMNGDQARARVLLQNAAEFGGPAPHVVAMLRLGQQPVQGVAQPGTGPTNDRPPMPESVEKVLGDNQNWLPARPLAKARQNAPNQEPAVPRAAPQQPAKPDLTPPALPAEPASPIVPMEAEESVEIEPGYAPIPKKGSVEPAEEIAPSEPAPKAQEPVQESNPVPAAPTSDDQTEESGPIIPVPGSANP